MPHLKLIITMFIMSLCINGAEWNDPALPMADTNKPVYQWFGWPPPGNMWIGGKCHKVRIPSADDLKEKLQYEYEQKLQEIRLAEIRRGSNLFLIGCIMAGIGFLMHFMTAYPIAQRFSEWVLVGGLGMAGIGLVVKKAAQYQNWLIFGAVIIVAGYALYKGKDWSLSHIFKGKGRV